MSRTLGAAPPLPAPLRAQLVAALANLIVADLEHYPELAQVDAGAEVTRG